MVVGVLAVVVLVLVLDVVVSSVVVVARVDVLVVLVSDTSLQSASTPPVLPLPQDNGNFLRQARRQEAPSQDGISMLPSGIGSQPVPSQQ